MRVETQLERIEQLEDRIYIITKDIKDIYNLGCAHFKDNGMISEMVRKAMMPETVASRFCTTRTWCTPSPVSRPE